MSDQFKVVEQFEQALCEYTGAKYAVTTTSCTQAILIALAWSVRGSIGPVEIEMPALSYVGVPGSIKNAGAVPSFRDDDWQGEYSFRIFRDYVGEPARRGRAARIYRDVNPTVWDSARRFTSGMFRPMNMQCVSFHWGKILGLSQGGAILHDNDDAHEWLQRATFDGRKRGVPIHEDTIQYPSWHCYMSPEVAAHGLCKLAWLPKHNSDLPRSDYPDLREIFK